MPRLPLLAAAVPLVVVVAVAGCGGSRPAVSLESLRAQAEHGVAKIRPAPGTGRNAIFRSYEVPGRAEWADGPLRSIDLSGVAFDHPRTATLISPQHVLMAQHYRREAGAPVVFHDRSGRQHIGYLTAVKGTPGGIRRDLAVGRLLKPVAVRPYRVLPPRTDYASRLAGVPVLVTDQDRRVFVHRVRKFTGRLAWFGPSPGEGPSKRLVKGDSGNPSFLLLDGEPVLVQIQSGTGWGVGPFLSEPANFTAINRLMREVGGNEQLQVVPLRP